MKTTFGEVLRLKRRKAGISQRKLASLVNVDFSYISKIENDRIPAPAADTIIRMAGHLDCPSEELLAAANKLPDSVQSNVSRDESALRFLQEATELGLSSAEWETMRGSLRSLRNSPQERGRNT